MFTLFSRPIATLAQFALHVQQRREQVRAQRILDSLPEYLRKDIGWPDRELERETRVPVGKSSRKLWDAEAVLARTECPSLFGLDKGNLHVRNGA
ncbi:MULTISPECIES: hypothetical protein [Mesorhizobium]|nr:MULTISPECIES: hypothetical protein [Mesorhizobium]